MVDSDEDTISDREEMGTYYLIEVDEENQVLINGEEPDDNSSFSYVAELFQELGKGKWSIYGVASNPRNKDSDNDDVDDEMDAKPLKKNPPITYILYDNSEWFLVYEKILRVLQKDSSEKIDSILITTDNQFISEWNSLGENRDGKQMYTLDEVIIVSHGGFDHISFGPKTERKTINTSDVTEPDPTKQRYLERKKIRSLILSSCNGGDITKIQTETNGAIKYDSNMATAFISWGTIGAVYAWNGYATYLGGANVHLALFDFQFSLEHSFSLEEQYIGLCVKTIGDIIACTLHGDIAGEAISGWTFICETQKLSEIGRVRYYLTDEGRIAYEKVPNISWSITHALYSS